MYLFSIGRTPQTIQWVAMTRGPPFFFPLRLYCKSRTTHRPFKKKLSTIEQVRLRFDPAPPPSPPVSEFRLRLNLLFYNAPFSSQSDFTESRQRVDYYTWYNMEVNVQQRAPSTFKKKNSPRLSRSAFASSPPPIPPCF